MLFSVPSDEYEDLEPVPPQKQGHRPPVVAA